MLLFTGEMQARRTGRLYVHQSQVDRSLIAHSNRPRAFLIWLSIDVL